MRVLVDTNVMSWLLSPHARDLADPYRALIDGHAIVLSFVSEAELRFGAGKGRWGPARRQRLEQQLHANDVVWPDRQLARTYAQLRLHCHRRGHALGAKDHEADRWIAATAVRLGVPLVTHDRAFVGIDGLAVLTRLD